MKKLRKRRCKLAAESSPAGGSLLLKGANKV